MLQHSFIAVLILMGALSGCQETGAPRGFALPEGDAQQGRVAFEELKCFTCHEVAGLEDDLPRPTATPVVDVKLGGLAMREPTDGELLTSIANPSHSIYPAGEKERIVSGEGSRMANLNEVMTVQQLIDLVAFLHERYTTTEQSGS
ncbi:MAG TPA: c-type cytochrome [Vicinamibacteria bacterium]|nr:c-type cytochrome [Vicinamibacteria bacterium]